MKLHEVFERFWLSNKAVKTWTDDWVTLNILENRNGSDLFDFDKQIIFNPG